MFRNKLVSCLSSSFKGSNRFQQLEVHSNPPVSPFFKRDSLHALKPFFGKQGKGRFFADAGRNYVVDFWVTTLGQTPRRRLIWSLAMIAFALGGIPPQSEAGEVFSGVQSKGSVR